MSMKQKVSILAAVVVVFMLAWVTAQESGWYANAAPAPQVAMSIVGGHQNGNKWEASDWPVNVDVVVTWPQNPQGNHVHLFHVEQGQPNYFYHGSLPIYTDTTSGTLAVYPGGKLDVNKYYTVFAIINTTSSYPKNGNVHMVTQLPEKVVGTLSLYRK